MSTSWHKAFIYKVILPKKSAPIKTGKSIPQGENMRDIHIGSDHAGYELKNLISASLTNLSFNIIDHGTNSRESCDYPLIAQSVCKAVAGDKSTGILICGTGIGMSIAANRIKAIRAALCPTELQARLARRHNNANILCLGARVIGPELAIAITMAFLESDFEGGRHERRLEQLNELS